MMTALGAFWIGLGICLAGFFVALGLENGLRGFQTLPKKDEK